MENLNNPTKSTSISVFQIENTNVYKSLDPMQKKSLTGKTVRHSISHGINVSINTSFDNWNATFHPTERVKNAVIELLPSCK